jgi:hypothetical protein
VLAPGNPNHTFTVSAITDIAVEKSGARYLTRCYPASFRIARDQYYLRYLSYEQASRGQSDSSTPAGDKRYLVLQSHLISCS